MGDEWGKLTEGQVRVGTEEQGRVEGGGRVGTGHNMAGLVGARKAAVRYRQVAFENRERAGWTTGRHFAWPAVALYQQGGIPHGQRLPHANLTWPGAGAALSMRSCACFPCLHPRLPTNIPLLWSASACRRCLKCPPAGVWPKSPANLHGVRNGPSYHCYLPLFVNVRSDSKSSFALFQVHTEFFDNTGRRSHFLGVKV